MPAPTHLLELRGLPAPEVRRYLRRAQEFSRQPSLASGRLAGRVVANLFFEDSTRTRNSFSVAAFRLGASVIDLTGSGSSISKGETLVDTARTVEALGVSALVVRTRQSGAASLIADRVEIPVLNAGDGRHEHPTQGLLDALTLAEAAGRGDSLDLSGLTLAIVGDVVSSRVARSAIAGFGVLGARVVCVGPPTLAPRALEGLGVEVSHELDPVLARVDAVMMLRIQFERHEGGKPEGRPDAGESRRAPVIASVREYREFFAMTSERAARLRPGAWIMHPGPMNRGLEIDQDVADGPRSLIRRQVTTGVFVRMAALDLLARREG